MKLRQEFEELFDEIAAITLEASPFKVSFCVRLYAGEQSSG
jgi:hypothetical protein